MVCKLLQTVKTQSLAIQLLLIENKTRIQLQTDSQLTLNCGPFENRSLYVQGHLSTLLWSLSFKLNDL